MPRLLQHRLDPASRLARLMFAEYGIAVELEDIKPWTRDPQILEINPAATVPILVDDGEPPNRGVCVGEARCKCVQHGVLNATGRGC